VQHDCTAWTDCHVLIRGQPDAVIRHEQTHPLRSIGPWLALNRITEELLTSDGSTLVSVLAMGEVAIDVAAPIAIAVPDGPVRTAASAVAFAGIGVTVGGSVGTTYARG
jgi:hypothetical protein